MREAAPLLGVSERQGWRLPAAYRKEGARGLAHKNRGRIPPNATPKNIQQQVVALAVDRYERINHTHLSELLAEREGLMLSRPTVRRILVRAGLSSPRHRRPPQHRSRRQRMPQEGMLLQLDGSHHLWLEDRGSFADFVTGCGRCYRRRRLMPYSRNKKTLGATYPCSEASSSGGASRWRSIPTVMLSFSLGAIHRTYPQSLKRDHPPNGAGL